jgi:hypothetical protein
MGNGNLTVFVESMGRYSLDGFAYSPVFGGQIGISDMMQLSGQFVPFAKNGLGPVEAHLQITTPGNDKLRFFGLALRADLLLSSTQDTLSVTAQSDKPEYNPYLLATAVADLDLLALWKFLPLKAYLSVGMMDNVDLLPFYNQLSIKSAVEWKMYRHSVFFGMGLGLYQEKSNRTTPGDKGFPQRYFWVEPGGRYRLLDRFCILGSMKFALFQKQKDAHPFKPELFNVALKIEAPILLRETNTEVIRTLIFMERKKEKKLDSFQAKIGTGKSLMNDMNAFLVDVKSAAVDTTYRDEKEALRKKREETHQKMEEIERLFIQLDKEESGKAQMNADTLSPEN